MLKLICGLFAVILSVSGTVAFGGTEVEIDPMVSLPTFTQIMSLSPADRREYLEVVQRILVIMAETSKESTSGLVADNASRATVIARYNFILALLQTFNTDAFAASGFPVQDVTEKVGDKDFTGRTCLASNNGICTQWTSWATTFKDKMMNKVGLPSLATKVDSSVKGTTQQSVEDKACTQAAQKDALSKNRTLLAGRVYAGNIIGYDTKRPASSFCSDSKVNMAKDPTKCPADEKVACKGSGQQLLCNPLVFSTVDATEGICVPPGGAATANCAKAAAAHKPGFDYLANAKGPITEAWQKFAKDFNSICTYTKGPSNPQSTVAEGKAMAQCSECGIMSKGMKSLNTKYKDKLFVNMNTADDKLNISPASGGVKSSTIPSGPTTISH